MHVGTLHRFKGLEYKRVAIAGVFEGRIPPRRVAQMGDEDPQRRQREMQRARSLLFVAATRARDAPSITGHGAPSPFLPSEGAGVGKDGAERPEAGSVDGALFKPDGAMF